MIRIEQINDAATLSHLGPAWRALLDRCPGTSPFQRPNWLLAWWENSGSGQLYVLAFSEHTRLVGLAPLFIHSWEGRRQVTLIGTGITDHLGLIAQPSYAMQCANLTFERLAADRAQWDLCDFQNLSHDSPLLAASPFGLELWPMGGDYCTSSPIPGGPSSPRLERNIRQANRRLERLGDFRLDTAADDPDNSLTDALLQLHVERWSDKGGVESMFDASPAVRILNQSTPGFASAGYLRIYTARLNGELIAAIYGVLHAKKLYGYLTGFHPAYRQFSVGSVLLDYARSSAAAEGAQTWEFLRGREPYKFLWGAVESRQSRLYAWHEARFCPSAKNSNFYQLEREQYEPVVA